MIKHGGGFPVAFGHCFDGGKDTAGRQHRALGERGDSNVAASPDSARFRGDLAGEHREKRGLSCPVETDDP
jgi:hypothetical protein